MPKLCRYCGIDESDHYDRYMPDTGWHKWTEPVIEPCHERELDSGGVKMTKEKTRNLAGVPIDLAFILAGAWQIHTGYVRGSWWELLYLSGFAFVTLGVGTLASNVTPAVRDSSGRRIKRSITEVDDGKR